jgi:hypothetical protein
MSHVVCDRRVFLGGLAAAVFVVGCATEEVVLGEWQVGNAEHNHTLFGFAQVKGGRAKVLLVRSTDEDGRVFAGPLIVSMPQLASERYDPESGRALEFQVWDEGAGEWQWLGVSTLDRIVQRGERYRVVLVETEVDAVATKVPAKVRDRVDAETDWALGSAA